MKSLLIIGYHGPPIIPLASALILSPFTRKTPIGNESPTTNKNTGK